MPKSHSANLSDTLDGTFASARSLTFIIHTREENQMRKSFGVVALSASIVAMMLSGCSGDSSQSGESATAATAAETEAAETTAAAAAATTAATEAPAGATQESDGDDFSVATGVSYDDSWGITVANIIKKDDQTFKILLDTVHPEGGLSSKEKFDDYGLKDVSSIGKEWWEQVSSFETWAEGNDLSTLNLDDSGHDVDAVTGATINLKNFTDAMENAKTDVAETDGFQVKTGTSYSDQWGITVVNVIYKDGEVFKVLADTVRPDGGLSSKEKFNDYGIKEASSMNKEWWEQIVSFEDWAKDHDVDDLKLDEEGHDVDAVTGATINVSYFVEAMKDAVSK